MAKFENMSAEDAGTRCVHCCLNSYCYKDPRLCVERCRYIPPIDGPVFVQLQMLDLSGTGFKQLTGNGR